MNFKLLAGGATGLFLLGGVLGAWAHRRFQPPMIEYKDREVVKVVEKEGKTQIKEVEGPVRIQTVTQTKLVPGPARPGPTIERIVTRVETRDPVVTDRTDQTLVDSRAVTQVVTLEKPLPDPPQWAAGAALHIASLDVFQLALDRRLAGPVWLTVNAVQPTRLALPRDFFIGVRLEF